MPTNRQFLLSQRKIKSPLLIFIKIYILVPHRHLDGGAILLIYRFDNLVPSGSERDSCCTPAPTTIAHLIKNMRIINIETCEWCSKWDHFRDLSKAAFLGERMQGDRNRVQHCVCIRMVLRCRASQKCTTHARTACLSTKDSSTPRTESSHNV